MRGLRVGTGAALAAVVTAGMAMAASAPATGSELVASWQMEETSGSVMVDSTGNGLDGVIGPKVVLGEATPEGNKAYRFKGDWWVPDDERLVQIPDDPRLDPGAGTFKVTLRVKTGALDPNITQKGQANTVGGYWKFVVKKGWPRCHFRDATGKTLAIGFVNSTNPDTKVSDGEWHTISCARTATGVQVTIDALSKFKRGSIGPIDNHFPMVIGGKLACDYVTVTCDYYAGAIDWVTLERP
jgi:hypothetical protein